MFVSQVVQDQSFIVQIILNKYGLLTQIAVRLAFYANYANEINKKNALGKLMNIKKRNLKDLLRKAFDIWKNKMNFLFSCF